MVPCQLSDQQIRSVASTIRNLLGTSVEDDPDLQKLRFVTIAPSETAGMTEVVTGTSNGSPQRICGFHD